jgi:hypothetical protein
MFYPPFSGSSTRHFLYNSRPLTPDKQNVALRISNLAFQGKGPQTTDSIEIHFGYNKHHRVDASHSERTNSPPRNNKFKPIIMVRPKLGAVTSARKYTLEQVLPRAKGTEKTTYIAERLAKTLQSGMEKKDKKGISRVINLILTFPKSDLKIIANKLNEHSDEVVIIEKENVSDTAFDPDAILDLDSILERRNKSRSKSRSSSFFYNENKSIFQNLLFYAERYSPKRLLPKVTALIPYLENKTGIQNSPSTLESENIVVKALKNQNFEALKTLKNAGFDFSSGLLKRIKQNDFDESKKLLHGLIEHRIFSEDEIKLLLFQNPKDNFSHRKIQALLELRKQSIPQISRKKFVEDEAEINDKFLKKFNRIDALRLANLNHLFENLPVGIKEMAIEALNEPFNINSSALSPNITLPYTNNLNQYNSGAHFNMGGTDFPRVIGLVSMLEAISKNPQKTVRLFTHSPRRSNALAYEVNNFARFFPPHGRGRWRHDINQDLARNFTQNLNKAMSIVRDNHQGQLNNNTLDKVDIAFTQDNGDTHDVACKLLFKNKKGKLTCDFYIIDSIPEEKEKELRPSQDDSFRHLDTLITAYFKAHGLVPPKIDTKVIYQGTQVNGFCTSLAVQNMLAPTDKALYKPAIGVKTDKDGKVTFDTKQYNKFMESMKNKIITTGKFVPNISGLSEHITNKDQFRSNLLLAYRAFRMDAINVKEGAAFDMYKTLPHSTKWQEKQDEAKKQYKANPSLKSIFPTEKAYIQAKINQWKIGPAYVGPELVLMEPREAELYK